MFMFIFKLSTESRFTAKVSYFTKKRQRAKLIMLVKCGELINFSNILMKFCCKAKLANHIFASSELIKTQRRYSS